MRLRDKLKEILPDLLSPHAHEAIKGKELIARVRAVLGDAYSDQSLRSQFSFLALDADSCLARVENGQGYYLRPEGETPSLQRMFEPEQSMEADSPYYKALALSVRRYDTAGLGVFVYPVDEEESWSYPDLVAVQWPAGCKDEQDAYVLEDSLGDCAALDVLDVVSLRAVCVALADSEDDCRRALFRALSCGAWAHQVELMLWGDIPDEMEEQMQGLASQYGVGLHLYIIDPAELEDGLGADAIFRASTAEIQQLLENIPQRDSTMASHRRLKLPSLESRADIAALISWVEQCVRKGRIESYEQRVAVH